MNSNSAMFTTADTNSQIRKWEYSSYFRSFPSSAGLGVEASAGGWVVAGHWSNSPVNLSGATQGARPSTTTVFAIDDLSVDAGLTAPLAYYAGNTTYTTGIRQQADYGDANTSNTVSSAVIFDPKRLDRRGSELFGFRGVFQIVDF